MRYLIDTNIISETIRARPNLQLINWLNTTHDESLFTSVLSIAELRKGIYKTQDLHRRDVLRQWLENYVLSAFENRILTIDLEVAERWARLQAETKNPLPAIDSLLAATALHYDMVLVTRNIKDFNFPGLEVLNPWDYT